MKAYLTENNRRIPPATILDSASKATQTVALLLEAAKYLEQHSNNIDYSVSKINQCMNSSEIRMQALASLLDSKETCCEMNSTVNDEDISLFHTNNL